MKFGPGNTWVGVLGGGQLGRMLCLEARRMGYHVIQWVGGPDSGPAGLADVVLEDPFDSEEALESFTRLASVATVEFENIPQTLLETVAAKVPMAPGPEAVCISQHREREKAFLAENGFPCAWYRVVDSADTLSEALGALPEGAGILKTAEFGYDGKGQTCVSASDDAPAVWKAFDTPRAVLEQRIDLKAELSVLVVRGRDGCCVSYDPTENVHRNHILDLSIVPGRFSKTLLEQAQTTAKAIAECLDYHGVLAVEFFVSGKGELLVNELAPRPHNSGHHTLDACMTSQFEQQLRMACDLPLGSAQLLKPVVMSNLLGDLWGPGGQAPHWQRVLEIAGVHLHLYGKRQARPGRKMGHLTALGDTLEDACAKVLEARQSLGFPAESNASLEDE